MKDKNLKDKDKNDIMSSLGISEYIMLSKKEKYLDKHKYSIWQSKDGKYWYTYFPDKTKKTGYKQIRRHSKLEIDLEIIKYYESLSERKLIEDVFIEWNDHRLELNKISKSTHLRNEQIFNKHFGDIAQDPIDEMSPDDFSDFLEEQIPKHSLTSKAFSNLKGIVKGMLKLARKRGYINYTADDVFAILDISDRSFRKVIKEDEDEVYNEEEMEIILKYLTDNKDPKNLGILLMFVTGIRVGELVALKHSDFQDNVVKIRRTETRVPKEERSGSDYIVKEFPKSAAGVRSVVIPEEFLWLAQVLSYGEPDEFVFINEEGDRLTTNAIRRRLERVCKYLGIKQKSPHKIRKTYGSILLDNNVDNNLIKGQMGHTDIGCTETHYHRNRKDNEKKSEIISNIPDFKAVSNL